MNRTESLIIKNLLDNKDFGKKVSPFLDTKFFDGEITKIIIRKYTEFVNTYKSIPNYEEVIMRISKDLNIPQNLATESITVLEDIKKEEVEEFTFDALVDMTEHYFQEVGLEYAITKGAEILASEEKRIKKAELPELMREALKISFKNEIGHEYATDNSIESQYHFYHHKDRKFPFPEWKTLTGELKGGCSKKKIHIYLAGTNVGKTLALVNTAIQLLKSGCNVLYISAEISEHDIIERVDGNMLDTNTDELVMVQKERYKNKLQELRKESEGRLIVKEYPTAFATVNHVRALLDELEVKEDFRPDFIVIDYLNIFGSIRFRNLGETYTLVKAVTEEFRGLAVEKNIGVWTATQTNRSGFASTDLEMTDISDSFGTAMTADLIISIIENDDMKLAGQYMFKLLKSRYAPINPLTQKWKMGVNKDKQQIYEITKNRDGIVSESVDTSKGGKRSTGKKSAKKPKQKITANTNTKMSQVSSGQKKKWKNF